jgi:hypothetical protein
VTLTVTDCPGLTSTCVAVVTVTAPLGCTVVGACNYDPAAICDDGSCTFPGCTDIYAMNYDPAAGCDDGSCAYPVLVINEIHYNPDDGAGFPDTGYEYLEIYNAEAVTVDISGYTFSLGVNFTFPPGTTLAAGEYIVVAANAANYVGAYQTFDYSGSLSNNGEQITLETGSGIVIDDLTYDELAPWPLYADGNGPTLALNNTGDDNADAANWHWSDCVNYVNGSPGAANPGPLAGCTDIAAANYEPCAFIDDGSCIVVISDIVINEIHYNPCPDQGNDAEWEFLELYNQSGISYDISGWTLVGLEFTFPPGSIIAPGEYIIVALDATSYTGNGYQVFETTNPGSGLNNNGEAIILEDDLGNIIDVVIYDDGGSWPSGPDGDCTTLELIDASLDNNDPASWGESLVFGGTPGGPNSLGNFYDCTDCGGGSTTITTVDDDFESGTLGSWVEGTPGDWVASGTSPINGSFSLEHNLSGVAGSSYISHDLGCLLVPNVCTRWNFQLESNGWITDASNGLLVWLVADNQDLSGATTSGYAVAVDINASATGRLTLVRMDNGAITSVLISTTFTWTAGDIRGIEVLHTEANTWIMKVDLDGGFDALLAFAATPVDNTYSAGTHTGIHFTFDSAGAGGLRVDDFTVEQCGVSETYYSVDTGNVGDAIWNTNPTAGVGNGNVVGFNSFKSAVVTNLQTVGLDQDIILNELAVGDLTYGAGDLNVAGSEKITLLGNWKNDGGSFSANTGTVAFKGISPQDIEGTTTTTFFAIESENSTGVIQLQDVELRGPLYPETGIFDINGFGFRLLSDANSTGSIAEIKTGADVLGPQINMQRYIPALIGSPMTWMNVGNCLENALLTEWDDDITTTGFPGADFEYGDYPFINIYSYDETVCGGIDEGFVAPLDITDPLLSDEGYMVFLELASQLLEVTGDFQKGSLTRNLSYSVCDGPTADGFHLMVNRYPSEVNIIDLYNASANLNSQFYKHESDGFTGTRNYIFYDVVTGLGSATPFMASNQSFWVKSNVGGATVNWEEYMKSETGEPFERGLVSLPVFAMILNGENSSDYTGIAFDDSMTMGLDEIRDGLHLGPIIETTVGLATVIEEDMRLCVNNMPWPESTASVPVYVKIPEAQELTIEIVDWQLIPDGACIVLEDLITGEFIPVHQDMTYSFTSEIFEGNRFLLHFAAPLSADINAVSCYGGSNGSITVSGIGEGPFTYTWYDEDDMLLGTFEADGSMVMENLILGNYTVVIESEGSLCGTTTQTFYVDQPSQQSASFSSSIDPCNQSSSGQIILEVDAEIYNYNLYDEEGELVTGQADVSGISSIDALDGGLYTAEVITECDVFEWDVDISDPQAVSALIDLAVTEYELTGESIEVDFNSSVSNANDLLWFINGEPVSQDDAFSYVFTEIGDYTITLSASNDYCASTDEIVISINEVVTDISDLADMNIQLFTVQHGFEIAFDRFTEGTFYQLYASNGQIVKEGGITSNRYFINMNDYSAGIYLLQLRFGDQIRTFTVHER